MDFAQVAQVLSDPALRTMSPTDRELFLGEMQQLIQVLEDHHIELTDSAAELESSDAPSNKTALVIKYLAQWTRHVTETGVNERPLSVAHFVTWLKQHTRAADSVAVSGVKRARDSSDEDEDEEWTRHHASSDLTRVKRPRVTPSISSAVQVSSAEPSPAELAASGAEKRLSRYRSAPSKALLERIDLARQQRHCLVQHVIESALDHCYQVLAQGTVYTVKIAHIPTCNCANASRGIHCTHLLFVLLKVLRVVANDPVLYQRSLLTIELTKIYAPQQHSTENAPHCAICYEAAADPSDQLRECHVQSRDCLVHEPCLTKYKQARADLNLAVLCPHCESVL
jgi:hypothetical protein